MEKSYATKLERLTTCQMTKFKQREHMMAHIKTKRAMMTFVSKLLFLAYG